MISVANCTSVGATAARVRLTYDSLVDGEAVQAPGTTPRRGVAAAGVLVDRVPGVIRWRAVHVRTEAVGVAHSRRELSRVTGPIRAGFTFEQSAVGGGAGEDVVLDGRRRALPLAVDL